MFCCWIVPCPSGMSNAMPGSAFSHPLKCERKKYLYCSQVWQCSIINTTLIESSLPRITEDPWSKTSPQMLLTLLVFTTQSGGFSWALSHISCTKATEKLQLCASLVSSCEPAFSETKSCQTDGEVRQNWHQMPPPPRSAWTDWWDRYPTRSHCWRLHQHVILKDIWWCRRVCQTAEL